MKNVKKIIGLVMVHFFGVTMLWANQPVSFERQDSDHIKEIMSSGDQANGVWLYESIAALVMQDEAPIRSTSNTRTTMELVNGLTSTRYDRIVNVANSELANEKRRTASPSGGGYYWERWLEVFNRRNCEVAQGRSNGDPHIRTFDGERYDFQTAGDYRVARSKVVNFEVQTRQVRHDERISVNGAIVVNVNGDRVAIYAQDFPDNFTEHKLRINGEVVYNDKDVQYLKKGGVVRFRNGRYEINSPTGEQVQVRHRNFSGSALLEIDIFVPSCGAEFEGLLGDADGNRLNDLTLSRELLAEAPDNSRDSIFGVGRNNPEQRRRSVNRLSYIARDFGDQFIVSEDESHFEQPWVNIPDFIRYPSRHLTLSDLSDEQIADAMSQCRSAGVAEEDLMACVFDMGYVGLEPDLPATYTGNGVERGRVLPTSRSTAVADPNTRNVSTSTTVVRPRNRTTPIYRAPTIYRSPTTTSTGTTRSSSGSSATTTTNRSSTSTYRTPTTRSSGSSATGTRSSSSRTAAPSRSSSRNSGYSSGSSSTRSTGSSARSSSSRSSGSSARTASPSRSSGASPSRGGGRR